MPRYFFNMQHGPEFTGDRHGQFLADAAAARTAALKVLDEAMADGTAASAAPSMSVHVLDDKRKLIFSANAIFHVALAGTRHEAVPLGPAIPETIELTAPVN